MTQPRFMKGPIEISLPNPNQVVFVPKPNQIIAAPLSQHKIKICLHIRRAETTIFLLLCL